MERNQRVVKSLLEENLNRYFSGQRGLSRGNVVETSTVQSRDSDIVRHNQDNKYGRSVPSLEYNKLYGRTPRENCEQQPLYYRRDDIQFGSSTERYGKRDNDTPYGSRNVGAIGDSYGSKSNEPSGTSNSSVTGKPVTTPRSTGPSINTSAVTRKIASATANNAGGNQPSSTSRKRTCPSRKRRSDLRLATRLVSQLSAQPAAVLTPAQVNTLEWAKGVCEGAVSEGAKSPEAVINRHRSLEEGSKPGPSSNRHKSHPVLGGSFRDVAKDSLFMGVLDGRMEVDEDALLVSDEGPEDANITVVHLGHQPKRNRDSCSGYYNKSQGRNSEALDADRFNNYNDDSNNGDHYDINCDPRNDDEPPRNYVRNNIDRFFNISNDSAANTNRFRVGSIGFNNEDCFERNSHPTRNDLSNEFMHNEDCFENNSHPTRNDLSNEFMNIGCFRSDHRSGNSPFNESRNNDHPESNSYSGNNFFGANKEMYTNLSELTTPTFTKMGRKSPYEFQERGDYNKSTCVGNISATLPSTSVNITTPGDKNENKKNEDVRHLARRTRNDLSNVFMHNDCFSGFNNEDCFEHNGHPTRNDLSNEFMNIGCFRRYHRSGNSPFNASRNNDHPESNSYSGNNFFGANKEMYTNVSEMTTPTFTTMGRKRPYEFQERGDYNNSKSVGNISATLSSTSVNITTPGDKNENKKKKDVRHSARRINASIRAKNEKYLNAAVEVQQVERGNSKADPEKYWKAWWPKYAYIEKSLQTFDDEDMKSLEKFIRFIYKPSDSIFIERKRTLLRQGVNKLNRNSNITESNYMARDLVKLFMYRKQLSDPNFQQYLEEGELKNVTYALNTAQGRVKLALFLQNMIYKYHAFTEILERRKNGEDIPGRHAENSMNNKLFNYLVSDCIKELKQMCSREWPGFDEFYNSL